MTSAMPAWQDDLLAVYPYLLARLKTVSSVKAVLEAKDLAALTGDRQQLPLNGAVYVLLDGFTPKSANDNGREQVIELGFSVILTMTQYTPRPNIDGVGATLTNICRALQGFDPTDDNGRALTLTPFVQQAALPVRYEDGFAYFPLRFTTTVAVVPIF